MNELHLILHLVSLRYLGVASLGGILSQSVGACCRFHLIAERHLGSLRLHKLLHHLLIGIHWCDCLMLA
jgi:hypothetical protein